MSEEITTKRCSSCKELQPRSDFNRNRAHVDGLAHRCKSCKSAKAAAYYAAHADERRAYSLRYYAGAKDDPEYRARAVSKATAWAAANPERRKQIERRSRKKTRPQITAAQRERRHRNPDALRDASKRARERLQRGYVLQILKDGTCLDSSDIPQVLIEAKRALVQIRRVERDYNSSSKDATSSQG